MLDSTVDLWGKRIIIIQNCFQVLTETSVDGVIKYIQEGNCKNLITMAGAGISTCK